MTGFDKHPFRLVQLLLERIDRPIVLEFSRYIYTPQQLFDQRHTFQVDAAAVSAEWLQKILLSLRDGEELALHSRIKVDKRTLHMPMIDFVVHHWNQAIELELEKYLPRRIVNDLLVFRSGKSFHAYSPVLLTPSHWRVFMGRLLLINPPNCAQTVDARWIGHRLIGGFASLRWSCNTKYYQHLPEFVKYTDRLQAK